MTIEVILIVMGVEFLGFVVGVLFELALESKEKYAAFANLSLYTGVAIYLCFLINSYLLIPFTVFAVIGKIMTPILMRKWR